MRAAFFAWTLLHPLSGEAGSKYKTHRKFHDMLRFHSCNNYIASSARQARTAHHANILKSANSVSLYGIGTTTNTPNSGRVVAGVGNPTGAATAVAAALVIGKLMVGELEL